MLKLSKDEFANYYYSKIAQFLPKLKEEISKSALILKVSWSVVLLILFIMSCLWDKITLSLVITIITIIILAIPIIAYKVFYIKDKLEHKLYKQLFAVLNITYSYTEKSCKKVERLIKSVCKKSGEPYNETLSGVDDILTGNYNGLNYIIADAEISCSFKSEDFNGIFLATKLDKMFIGQTIIRTDKFAGKIANKQKINFEDIEFEKLFDVYSTDQIEARYIITTAFMERLKNYRLQKKYPIEVVFTNISNKEENAFFFLNTNKNHFEIPFNPKKLNKDFFYNILYELYDLLEIIDALKLEQNIGM